MIRAVLFLGAVACAWSAEPVVVDFEKAVPLLADGCQSVPQDGKKESFTTRP